MTGCLFAAAVTGLGPCLDLKDRGSRVKVYLLYISFTKNANDIKKHRPHHANANVCSSYGPALQDFLLRLINGVNTMPKEMPDSVRTQINERLVHSKSLPTW